MSSLRKAVTDVLKDDLIVSDPSVADKLIENDIISSDDWHVINKQPSNEQKVRRLVRHISKVDNPIEAFEHLVDTLKFSHTHLVTRTQEVIEDFKHKEPEDRNCQSSASADEDGNVRKYFDHQTQCLIEVLQKDLYVHDTGLVDGLIAEGVLDSTDWERISRAKRDKKKTKTLISCILKSQTPCNGLQNLRDLLAISHSHLKNLIEFDHLIQALKVQNHRTYSNPSSESECISDTTPSDLEPEEFNLFKKLYAKHDYTSDAIDEMIEEGFLSSDDYNAVHEEPVDRRRAAILSRILTRKSKVSGQAYLVSRKDLSVSSALPPAGIPNQREVEVLQKTFDKLNKQLNYGSLSLEQIKKVENNDALCIVNYFAAMEKIFAGDFDGAESVVEQIDSLLCHSRNTVYLRGEVMSAKSWLFLKTKRLGLLESFLEENLQLVQACSNVWSNAAIGWLYYEFCRSYIANLELIRFKNLRKNHCSLNWHNAQNECVRRAKLYIYRATDYFKLSTSSDGPIGLGCCNCLLLDLLLKCGERFESLGLECSDSDLREAEAIVEYMTRDDESIPPTVETEFMLCVCDLEFRKGNHTEAYKMAIKCYKRSEEMNMAEEMENSQNRIARLETLI